MKLRSAILVLFLAQAASIAGPLEELADLDRLSGDADPEMAASAKELRGGVQARRRFGPWLFERATALEKNIGEDRASLLEAAGSNDALRRFRASMALRALQSPEDALKQLEEGPGLNGQVCRMWKAWRRDETPTEVFGRIPLGPPDTLASCSASSFPSPAPCCFSPPQPPTPPR